MKFNEEELRSIILGGCLERADITYASGEVGNNKLELENIAPCTRSGDYNQYYHVRQEIGNRITDMAASYKPDYVVAVPNGASWLAEFISRKLYVGRIDLTKLEDKSFEIFDERNTLKAYRAKRLVIVEDVFNKFTNTRKVLEYHPLGRCAVAAVSIWDRGLAEERDELELPHNSVFTEPIPSVLDDNSELWTHKNHGILLRPTPNR